MSVKKSKKEKKARREGTRNRRRLGRTQVAVPVAVPKEEKQARGQSPGVRKMATLE